MHSAFEKYTYGAVYLVSATSISDSPKKKSTGKGKPVKYSAQNRTLTRVREEPEHMGVIFPPQFYVRHYTTRAKCNAP
jgi:hypothetical protein